MGESTQDDCQAGSPGILAPPRDASEIYRVMWKALSYLASQGYSVQPADAADLIQDFLTEVWPGLLVRYDPNRGTKFWAYAFGSFVRYSKPRIQRLRKWAKQLGDVEGVTTPPEEDPASVASSRELLAIVRDAVAGLPPLEMLVLRRYLKDGPRSERQIAGELRMSRFAVRRALIDALARCVTTIGQRGQIASEDWKVAICLWGDGLTPLEASFRLSVPVGRVRAARERVRKMLAQTVVELHSGPSDT